MIKMQTAGKAAIFLGLILGEALGVYTMSDGIARMTQPNPALQNASVPAPTIATHELTGHSDQIRCTSGLAETLSGIGLGGISLGLGLILALGLSERKPDGPGGSVI